MTELQPKVLWFTGLSGSGKSTIARGVVAELKSKGLNVEHLDGDGIRSLFPETGFTKDDRDRHIKWVGYLASVLERNGIFVVATFVSPYRETRFFVRSLCRSFCEVYISTPLDVCERRDVKGLYERARKGEIQHFTGISDPYEPPDYPELTIDTQTIAVGDAVSIVLNHALDQQYVSAGESQ